MAIARGHHYLSQVYLKRFTQDRQSGSQIYTIDIQRVKSFNTNIKNVALERDFNQILADNIDPNILERWLGEKFEPAVDQAIANIEATQKFEGEDKTIILHLMALFALRSPFRRDYKDDTINHIMKVALSFFAEAQVGTTINGIKITPEVKEAAANGDNYFKVILHQNFHVLAELEELEILLPLLHARQWTLIKAPDQFNFITCDRPVYLTWEEPDKYQFSPGFGLQGTQVIFPLTSKLVLSGTFETDGYGNMVVDAKETFVPLLNTISIMQANSQLYMPDSNFCFTDAQHNIQKGVELFMDIFLKPKP